VWIVQEVSVSPATVVCCGAQSISWDDLVTIVVFCWTKGLLISVDRQNVSRFLDIEKTRYWTTAGVDQGLLQLLLGYRSFKATDPKDKIYGLIGLSRTVGTVAVEIKPDYNQDVSVENTYLRAAISILKASQTIDIFSVPRSSTRSNMTGLPLPSWVPDWSIPERTFSLLLPGLGKEEPEEQERPQYRATGTNISVTHLRFQPDGLKVQLCGQLIDSVHKVGKVLHGDGPTPLPSEFKTKGAYENIKLLLDIFWDMCQNRLLLINWETITGARCGEKYITGEDILDVYWQTFLGSYTTRNAQGRLRSLQEERETWERNLGVYRLPCFLHLHHWNLSYAVATIVFESLHIVWYFLLTFVLFYWSLEFRHSGPELGFLWGDHV
jgi:hypothetical protein